jgi:hypothetical protein
LNNFKQLIKWQILYNWILSWYNLCVFFKRLYYKKGSRRGRDRFGSWLYQCNQCLSPLTLWARIPLRRGVLETTLCDTVCQWLATGWWFSPGTPVSSTNKTDSHDIAEILFKVALNTITHYKQIIIAQNKKTRYNIVLINWKISKIKF